MGATSDVRIPTNYEDAYEDDDLTEMGGVYVYEALSMPSTRQ